jgi:hypothetical protein
MAKMLNGNNGSRSQPSSPTIEVIDSPDGENEVKEKADDRFGCCKHTFPLSCTCTTGCLAVALPKYASCILFVVAWNYVWIVRIAVQ